MRPAYGPRYYLCGCVRRLCGHYSAKPMAKGATVGSGLQASLFSNPRMAQPLGPDARIAEGADHVLDRVAISWERAHLVGQGGSQVRREHGQDRMGQASELVMHPMVRLVEQGEGEEPADPAG